MDVSVRIGQNYQYELHEALLIYRSKQDLYSHRGATFVTRHEVRTENAAKQPTLGPAMPLSLEFVQQLVRGLGGQVAVEYLSENILARTERIIAWWTPAQKRRMYSGSTQGDLSAINGAVFPQPPLLWMASDFSLSVRALKENRRPEAKTPLCVAPYWNLYADGSVCIGTMRAPKASTVASVSKWEKSFYESEFTHGNVGRVTRHPQGFEGLWKELAGAAAFPVETLIELPETVEDFLCGKARGHDD